MDSDAPVSPPSACPPVSSFPAALAAALLASYFSSPVLFCAPASPGRFGNAAILVGSMSPQECLLPFLVDTSIFLNLVELPRPSFSFRY